MSKLVLLDYDGYICKAYYACLSKSNLDLFYEVLHKLELASLEKARIYFNNTKDIRVIKAVSSHSFKKDLYSTYKQTRKKDDYIGVFRDDVINSDKSIIKLDGFEADDIIGIIVSVAEKEYMDYVVFSDDKDLKYISELYCKINLTEEIETRDYQENLKCLYSQMLAGDKEDNIQGIPKIGMKTAEKLLGDNFNMANVFKIYKEMNVPLQEAIKQVTLITPTLDAFNFAFCSLYAVGDMLITGKGEPEGLLEDVKQGHIDFIKTEAEIEYGVHNYEDSKKD